jgi:hypothetical protein
MAAMTTHPLDQLGDVIARALQEDAPGYMQILVHDREDLNTIRLVRRDDRYVWDPLQGGFGGVFGIGVWEDETVERGTFQVGIQPGKARVAAIWRRRYAPDLPGRCEGCGVEIRSDVYCSIGCRLAQQRVDEITRERRSWT